MQARRPHRSSHFEVDRALLAAIPILLVASLHLLLPMIARNHKPLAKHESLVSETIVLGAAHDNPDGRPLEDSLAFKQQLKPALIKEDEVAYRELVQLLQRRLLQGARKNSPRRLLLRARGSKRTASFPVWSHRQELTRCAL